MRKRVAARLSVWRTLVVGEPARTGGKMARGGPRWQNPPSAPTPPAPAWSTKAALTGNIAANTARRKDRASSCVASAVTQPADDPHGRSRTVRTTDRISRFAAAAARGPPDGRQWCLQFIGGDPGQVVVLLTDASVIVSSFAGGWETPFNFVVEPRRVGLVKWKRLPETPLLNAISALIKGAREARLSQFQTCQYCGKHTAPEWLHDDQVCQGCADRQLGVVH